MPRTKTAKKSSGATKKKSAGKSTPPKAKHKDVSIRLCVGEDVLTAAQAKELLGWEAETEKVKFGGNFLFKDADDKKIRCINNVTNRPIYKSVYLTLMQEHLRRRWRMNGEPIIVGATEQILNGQHTLISLVLAAQEWHRDKPKWSSFWKTEPTMQKLIVFGIAEDDEVVNTMDTCKPRTLADVIYRSKYFASYRSQDRKAVSRMASNAIRMMWHRTGASAEAFAPHRTHAESLDFLARHSRLLECVKHIYEEQGDEQRITRYAEPGYASALLYLMGSSATDPKEYAGSDTPNEDSLDWANWDKACNFWVLLASNADELFAVRNARDKIVAETGNPPSVAEQCALLAKAWLAFVAGDAVTEKSLRLKYHTDDEGNRWLTECPTAGGIDVGDISKDASVPKGPPSPEQIKERASVERAKRTTASADKPSHKTESVVPKSKKKKKRRKPGSVAGRMMWVRDGSDPWRGKVVDVVGSNAKVKVAQGFQGAGSIKAVKVANLHAEQPENGVQECPECGGNDYFDDGTCRTCY